MKVKDYNALKRQLEDTRKASELSYLEVGTLRLLWATP